MESIVSTQTGVVSWLPRFGLLHVNGAEKGNREVMRTPRRPKESVPAYQTWTWTQGKVFCGCVRKRLADNTALDGRADVDGIGWRGPDDKVTDDGLRARWLDQCVRNKATVSR